MGYTSKLEDSDWYPSETLNLELKENTEFSTHKLAQTFSTLFAPIKEDSVPVNFNFWF